MPEDDAILVILLVARLAFVLVNTRMNFLCVVFGIICRMFGMKYVLIGGGMGVWLNSVYRIDCLRGHGVNFEANSQGAGVHHAW